LLTNAGSSRTLDPSTRSFVGVTGLHDKKLSDADLNLIQSVQDLKRQQVLGDHVCSGALTYAPFIFSARTIWPQSLSFTVPAFDALVNGQVVTVGGNLSNSLSLNSVVIPPPVFWSPGSTSPAASIYITFVEFWYQRVEAIAGTGYYKDPGTGLLYYYPNGCVNAVVANMISNDSIDPFQGVETTERAQLQWAIRVQAVDLAYDFTKYAFGLDPGATTAETVYGQASQAAPSNGSPYQFTNMGGLTGDTGLWRSGNGNYLNELGSMDGYSYALPLAVIFQRNTGVYSPDQNPFGSANPTVAGSGTLASAFTARYDGKFADLVFPEDVVDTRSVIALAGWDNKLLLQGGFVDVISGKTQIALARGQTPGSLSSAVGSILDYTITVAPTSVANTNTIGAFDGYRNGFSSASYTSYSCQAITVDQKSTGLAGSPWVLNDSFVITLPAGVGATIEYAQVQGLVNDAVNNIRTPVLFLSGQVTVSGLGTKSITVQFVKNLTGTTYDPGMNPLYVTLGLAYVANGGMDLVQIPAYVSGGTLKDASSGKTIPVFGVSTYQVSANLPILTSNLVSPTLPALTSVSAYAYNPGYSNIVFGTRIGIAFLGSNGTASVDSAGNPSTTFALSRTGLNTTLTGLYVVSASDMVTGKVYPIINRSISGLYFTLQLEGAVAATAVIVAVFLAADTAQLSYTAPVKAVTLLEETVIAGTVTDITLQQDPRVSVVSVKNYPSDHNSVVLATTSGMLTGIAGDDINKLIWVKDTNGNYNAVQIASATFANGFVTLNVPPSVNLEVQPFFVVAALLPAFTSNSQLTLIESYVPYQGEGLTARDYEILSTDGFALVTTNGTGTAPVPGLRDIYPYNREFPVASALPAQVAWSDATLLNQPVASFFDSNFVAKAFNNVEHTFEVPAHTNDFIQPINGGKRKSFQLSIAGGRGYARAIPHFGFAIQPVNAKTALGVDVTSTVAAVTLYVNNGTGNDSNDGLTPATALLTIGAALEALPSVLKHPCSIQLVATGLPYLMSSLSSSLQVVALGDGLIRQAKYYALGVIGFQIQGSGRLVITAQAGTTGVVTIDATGFAGFGDGPTSAFFIDNSRVLFNQIAFEGFTSPAVKGLDADVEFVNCVFTGNLTAGSFEQGSTIIVSGGTITLGNAGTGFILSESELDASAVTLTVQAGAAPGAFFVAERGSSLTLMTHGPSEEINMSAGVVIANAELNSSVVVSADFSSQGTATISKNSVLARTVAVNPFNGGVTLDSSSSVSTSL